MTRKDNFRCNALLSRVLSFCLVLAMLLTLLPAVRLVPEVNAASTGTATVYFRNTHNWDSVYGYTWIGDTPMNGSWPGQRLIEESGFPGNYAIVCKYTVGTDLNVIFNNGIGSQTVDLSIDSGVLTSGSAWVAAPTGEQDGKVTCSITKVAMPKVNGNQVTFTYTGSASGVKLAGTMNNWQGAAMTKNGNVFTYTTTLEPGYYEYKFVVDGNWTADPANPYVVGNDGNSAFVMGGMPENSITAQKGTTTALPAALPYATDDGAMEYRVVTYALESAVAGVSLAGRQLTVSSGCTASSIALIATAGDTSTTVTVKLTGSVNKNIKIHFLNNVGWDVVCAHTWNGSTNEPLRDQTGEWPGSVLTRDANGYYTLEVAYTGGKLGYLFHNNQGSMTVDLTMDAATVAQGNVEVWVQANGESGGKYTCSVVSSESALFRSPVVSGSQVTFRYKASGTTAQVYVVGTMNGWNNTASKMTKGADGVYTCTMTLEPGAYQYKFYEKNSDTWFNDPCNFATVGPDGNNTFVVPGGEAVEPDTITVKLHYYRKNGSYTNWNVWAWCEGMDGAQYQFADENGEKVATITVTGSTTARLGYIIRKGNWQDQENFGDRMIDLTAVGSGTVHYYVTSGVAEGVRILDTNITPANKIVQAEYDYDSGKIRVWTSLPLTADELASFSCYDASGAGAVQVEGVQVDGSTYLLRLNKRLDLETVHNHRVKFGSTSCAVTVGDVFGSDRFVAEYTYDGDDLGASWSAGSTTFKVWAPTAKNVAVKLYDSGNYGSGRLLQTVSMTRGSQGVWTAVVSGNLHGTYYNYDVTFSGYTVEATDPYAQATGANGDRGMVINMDAVNPAGWDSDVTPHAGKNYTDAIIYEMHVREYTIDGSSGVRSDWKGTYLGLTQSGTTTAGGKATGLDHLKEMGVTHVQLMPVFDFASNDEYKLDVWQQYAWGYDPKNYNVPDGSYSTDPFNGTVRISEFKQMVKTLHDNGISVVMDVVYNHAFDGGNFCFNKIVPNYFSRFDAEGKWSNGSGCGNDTASEREMVRKFIVDSVMHWVEEYHIDGFRFDLVGLLDVTTVNEIVETVHAKYPHVIFYGEGWDMSTAAAPGTDLAHKGNAWQTPGFGYFNDTIRDLLAGYNGQYTGVVSGATGKEEPVANAFRAQNYWSSDPNQTINYVACHDNYGLMDKLAITRPDASRADLIKMNNLAAAIYMTAQGIPMIYSGEELLREKINEQGYRLENSFSGSDYANSIKWSKLDDSAYAGVSDYYKGLVELRKAHAALRLTSQGQVSSNVSYHWMTNEVVLFKINGGVNGEIADGIVVIFNMNNSARTVNLYNAGVASGTWNICVNDKKAGTDVLGTVTNGSVTLAPLSAMVLVKGKTGCNHSYVGGTCTICGEAEPFVELDYYLFGWINGANYACEENSSDMGTYKFTDGKLTTTFRQDSYVAVKTTGNRDWYMTNGWMGTDVTAVTLYSTAITGVESNKLFVPGGVEVTFTLVDNGDGSFTLSYEKAYDVSEYRSGSTYTYPVKEGFVFAGWYTDAALTQPLDKDTTTGIAYAKFVSERVLSVKWQVTAGTTASTPSTTLRLVTTVDSLNYSNVGFRFRIGEGKWNTRTSTTVYSQIKSNTAGVVFNYKPTVFHETSKHFLTRTVTGVPSAYYDTAWTVEPFWVTLDGTEVTGVSRTFQISDFYNR